jgi:hypothetical protein
MAALRLSSHTFLQVQAQPNYNICMFKRPFNFARLEDCGALIQLTIRGETNPVVILDRRIAPQVEHGSKLG